MANQPTASHRVFHIPELLEQILLNLEDHPAALISCMRVDKTFHDTIAGSTLLQQALYLKHSSKRDNETGSIFGNSNRLLYSKRYEKRLDQGGCISVGHIFGRESSVQKTVRLYYTGPILDSRLHHAGASWRRMYLMRGNHAVVKLQISGPGCHNRQLEGVWVNPTMGELVDAVMP